MYFQSKVIGLDISKQIKEYLTVLSYCAFFSIIKFFCMIYFNYHANYILNKNDIVSTIEPTKTVTIVKGKPILNHL